jgi:hypothetical protein
MESSNVYIALIYKPFWIVLNTGMRPSTYPRGAAISEGETNELMREDGHN